MADLDAPGAAAPGQVRVRRRDRRGEAIDALVSGGCIISGATVRRSLLFSKVHVHSFSLIEDSVLLGNNDVGRDCVIRRAVIDKGCNCRGHAHRRRPRRGPAPLPRDRARRDAGHPRHARQQIHHLR